MGPQVTTAIFGPPGTGKTSALMRYARIADELGTKTLYLAFTRAAAQEINNRAGHEVAMTIHAFCFRQLGLAGAQVVNRDKLKAFGAAINIPMMGGGMLDMVQMIGDEYLAVLSFANNRLMPAPEAYDALGRPGTPGQFEYFVAAYERWKNEFGYIDFDDMLDRWFNSSMAPPEYGCIFLDEAQDLTRAQWVVFHKIIERTPNIMIAGDDDQAIFQWMGAIPEGMGEFMAKMDARKEVLSQSYRVPISAYNIAGDVIRKVARREEKEYNPTQHSGSVREYLSMERLSEDLRPNQDALWLFRDRFKMLQAQYTLNHAMIPYKVAGGASPWIGRNAQLAREGRVSELGRDKQHFYEMAIESGAIHQPVHLELSTIHKAKGREHRRVVVSVEGSGRALENMYEDPDAELRVLYVALTRTKDELWLHGHHPAIFQG